MALVLMTVVSGPAGLKGQTEWTHATDRPVLSFGEAGTWDSGAVIWPTVVRDGKMLRMWYAGSDNVLAHGAFQIGMASSRDGLTWSRDLRGPVLSAELSWEGKTVISPTVLKDGDTLKMWYGAAGVPPTIVGYATSTDGIKWTKHPEPVLLPGPNGDWDSSLLGPGTVIKEDSLYKMWYWGGRGNWPGSVIQVGLAISRDGITWIKHDDPKTTHFPFVRSDPVLTVGEDDTWDALRVWSPAVLPTDSGYEMWYAGRAGPISPPQLVGYASSADGIQWRKSEKNPIIENKPAWGFSYITSSVLKFEGFYHLWYTSFTFTTQEEERAQIGYAISRAYRDSAKTLEVPESFVLFQNYPNPFNSTTVLPYGLPHRARVEIAIYDVLGRHIRTLTRGVQEAGFKSLTWDGTDDRGRAVSTGMYLYHIQVDHISDGSGRVFKQTRKMLLLR